MWQQRVPQKAHTFSAVLFRFALKRRPSNTHNIHTETRYIRNESVVQTLEQQPPLPLHNSAGKMRERLELGVFSLQGEPLAPAQAPTPTRYRYPDTDSCVRSAGHWHYYWGGTGEPLMQIRI